MGSRLCGAASRVPSISKITRVPPSRSTRPPVASLRERGLLSQIVEKQGAQGARPGSFVRAEKSRERVERALSRSRSNKAHVGDRKGPQSLVESWKSAFAEDARSAIWTARKSMTSYCPKRRRGIRARAHRSWSGRPARRRYPTIRATSPNHEGIEGADSEEVWILTNSSARVFMCASLMESVLFFLIKEAHFYPCSLQVTSRCASRGSCDPAPSFMICV